MWVQVNETAVQMEVAADDSINSVSSLSQEATFINQNFSQQVLLKVGSGTGGDGSSGQRGSTYQSGTECCISE